MELNESAFRVAIPTCPCSLPASNDDVLSERAFFENLCGNIYAAQDIEHPDYFLVKNRISARSGNVAPAVAIHSHPPFAYRSPAILEPIAPPTKILVI